MKNKRKGWRWLVGAIAISVLLVLGLLYTKLHNHQNVVPDQTPTLVQDKIQQGNQFINNLGDQLQTKLVNVDQQAQQNPLASTVSLLSTNLGMGEYTITLFSILLLIITLSALIAGWYLRRFGRKKWLGYLFSIIGFLPILPIMIAATVVYWSGKMYWRGSKARKKPTKEEQTNISSIVDDWEKSFNRLEKLQS